MRRLYLSWLLPLLMLVSQQGAYVHELSHLRPPAEQTQEKQKAADKLCDSCLAFAHLADFTESVVPQALLLTLSFGFEGPAADRTVAADAPGARSRGPPLFL